MYFTLTTLKHFLHIGSCIHKFVKNLFTSFVFQMDINNNDSVSMVAYSDDNHQLKLNTQFKICKAKFELSFSSSIEMSSAEEMKIVSLTGLDKVTELVNKKVSSITTLQVKEEVKKEK